MVNNKTQFVPFILFFGSNLIVYRELSIISMKEWRKQKKEKQIEVNKKSALTFLIMGALYWANVELSMIISNIK